MCGGVLSEAEKAKTGNVFADLTLGYFRNRKKRKEQEEKEKEKNDAETDINSEASAERYKNGNKNAGKGKDNSSNGFDKDENKIGHYVNFKQLLRPR